DRGCDHDAPLQCRGVWRRDGQHYLPGRSRETCPGRWPAIKSLCLSTPTFCETAHAGTHTECAARQGISTTKTRTAFPQGLRRDDSQEMVVRGVAPNARNGEPIVVPLGTAFAISEFCDKRK